MPELADVSWRPTVDQVGALIRARTKIRGSVEIGTFLNADEDGGPTRPTKDAVEDLIDTAMRRVSSAIGGYELCETAISDGLDTDAAAATAQYTAALVEQSYWPDQTQAPGSSFRSLMELFKDSLKTLVEAVGERCGGTAGEGAGGGSQALAKAGAPECPDLIGREGPVW